jgi:hypothetical protein
MLYRPHRGSLHVSMAEAVDVDGIEGLTSHLREELWNWPDAVGFRDDQVHVRPYIGFDDRTGWRDVHIVTIDGYGVMGFTQGSATKRGDEWTSGA